MTFTNDELQAMNRSTAGQGFTPKAKEARPAAALPGPADHQYVADLESSALTIRETINSMAGYSAQSTQALATQRDRIAEQVSEQMAALLDPDLFLQDVLQRTVSKLQPRSVEIPNFFDITLELQPLLKIGASPSQSILPAALEAIE